MRRLREHIANVNKKVFNPVGLNILWPKNVAFMFVSGVCILTVSLLRISDIVCATVRFFYSWRLVLCTCLFFSLGCSRTVLIFVSPSSKITESAFTTTPCPPLFISNYNAYVRTPCAFVHPRHLSYVQSSFHPNLIVHPPFALLGPTYVKYHF